MTPQEQIDAVEEAARALAFAMGVESERRLARIEHEAAVVASLIGNANPLTGKVHSATSAVEAAAIDEGTLRRKADIAQAEQAVVLARAAYEAARLRAQLAVAMVAHGPSFSLAEV